MRPPFSVVLLTTLIGVGQGLFLALYLSEVSSALEPGFTNDGRFSGQFYGMGSALTLAFLIAGLAASFFHLGHPERAWKAAAQWRISWLSREVIVLPLAMVFVAAYGVLHYLDVSFGGITNEHLTLMVGAGGIIAILVLFLCTAMIYACIHFLQEWASPLTVVNYTLLGSTSGFTLAAAYASHMESGGVLFFAAGALGLIAVSLLTRLSSLARNARLKPRSTMQSAIGVRHNRIVQTSRGFTGRTFNVREFFHGAPSTVFELARWAFLVLVFPVPAVLLVVGLLNGSTGFLVAAFLVQYFGLLIERWFFFAQANHPQNLYYQVAE